ncbi:hypothetical protein [Actinoallomurus iriomotensis]|uniref:Uncharacterized protein n=1 Tax=Actinoallomurus iriomotensis TaxID=478107 RepID=A0A9W6RN75_9ACTN|nr:hypothetical protein [Actinoallomurus iriomotensis]GLY79361.1 hypothetical protein Airi01_076280 [Actinoallomurus iriomotensis]
MVDIEVRSRMPGTSGDDLPAVLVRLAEDRTTVRELIRRTVEEQIRALRADTARRRRILDRQYLSGNDLRTQARNGAIKMPPQAPADPDVTTEVGRAHRAFSRGTFAIFAGGRQVVDLDEEFALRLGEPVVFLRLVALAGG